jgi:predicted dehydrogenase
MGIQASENIVALCDVDQDALARNAKLHPKAKLHSDYRKMLEQQKDIDAVVVATPDHSHAVNSMMASRWASTCIVRSR